MRTGSIARDVSRGARAATSPSASVAQRPPAKAEIAVGEEASEHVEALRHCVLG